MTSHQAEIDQAVVEYAEKDLVKEVACSASNPERATHSFIAHTPGPWKVNASGLGHGGPWDRIEIETCEPGGGTVVATVNKMISAGSANAAFIVRAVNSHDDLLAALKACLDWHIELVNSGDAGFWNAEDDDCVKQARAAISKATGATP